MKCQKRPPLACLSVTLPSLHCLIFNPHLFSPTSDPIPPPPSPPNQAIIYLSPFEFVSPSTPLSSDSPGWQGYCGNTSGSCRRRGVHTKKLGLCGQARQGKRCTVVQAPGPHCSSVPGCQALKSDSHASLGLLQQTLARCGERPGSSAPFSPGLWILVDNPQISNLPLPAPCRRVYTANSPSSAKSARPASPAQSFARLLRVEAGPSCALPSWPPRLPAASPLVRPAVGWSECTLAGPVTAPAPAKVD